MGRLSDIMVSTLDAMGGSDKGTARLERRIAEVRRMWVDAVQKTWRDADVAAFILAHTNGVGIVEEKNHRGETYKKLFVYVDDSIVLSEVNAMRERIKLLFLMDFGEEVHEFDIRISHGLRKNEHPFQKKEPPHYIDRTPAVPLSENEVEEVDRRIEGVPNEKVKESLRKAMIADLQWKKGKNDKNGN